PLRRGRRARRPATRPAGAAAPGPIVRRIGRRRRLGVVAVAQEIAEEIAIRRPDIAGGGAGQRSLERLHGPVEIEERGIAAIGGGIDGGGRRIALAAEDLALLAGIGRDHHRLLVGFGAQRYGVLLALGADLARLLLALGLHAAED